MGFLNNIFSIFARSTYKGICKAMIGSYNSVKKQNPNAPPRELYALALSLRPTWKRESPSLYTFMKGTSRVTIEEKDTFKDVVMKVIFTETSPPGIDQGYIMEVVVAVKEAFGDFKE